MAPAESSLLLSGIAGVFGATVSLYARAESINAAVEALEVKKQALLEELKETGELE